MSTQNKQKSSKTKMLTGNRQKVQVATALPKRNGGPKFSSKGNSVVIRHRELVADASSATTFAPQQVITQPGLASSFPWLSSIATSYEKYKVRKLTFEYEPQCATTSVGSFGMYYDYDPKDGAVTSKTDFASMSQAVLTQLWQSNRLEVIVDGRDRFVRSTAPTGDQSLYDLGSFNYYLQSTSTINGFIFVDYEIELVKPVTSTISQVAAGTLLVSRYNLTSQSQTSAVAPAAVSGFVQNGNYIQVPSAGTYLITVWFNINSSVVLTTAFGASPPTGVAAFSAAPITYQNTQALLATTDYQVTFSAATTGQVIITALKIA